MYISVKCIHLPSQIILKEEASMSRDEEQLIGRVEHGKALHFEIIYQTLSGAYFADTQSMNSSGNG
jgi:hypothetical protein